MARTASSAGHSGDKSAQAFRTISEVATTLDVPQHVLRFWESKFTQVRPLKRGGGRRYYRPDDVDLLKKIRALLYDDGYTIKGVQKLLRDGSLKPKRDAAAAPNAEKPLAPAAPASDAPAARKLSEAQRQELQSLLDELEQLKSMLERALD